MNNKYRRLAINLFLQMTDGPSLDDRVRLFDGLRPTRRRHFWLDIIVMIKLMNPLCLAKQRILLELLNDVCNFLHSLYIVIMLLYICSLVVKNQSGNYIRIYMNKQINFNYRNFRRWLLWRNNSKKIQLLCILYTPHAPDVKNISP